MIGFWSFDFPESYIYPYTLIVHILLTSNFGDVFILSTIFGEGGQKKWEILSLTNLNYRYVINFLLYIFGTNYGDIFLNSEPKKLSVGGEISFLQNVPKTFLR